MLPLTDACPNLVTAGILAWFHFDDTVSACGILHSGGFYPDDCLGQGQASQLPERVPWLPSSPLTHTAVYPVEGILGTCSPTQLYQIVGAKYMTRKLRPLVSTRH